MQKHKKLLIAKMAVVLSVIPALIYARSQGPDPRNTGAPGDKTCAQASCHIGTPNTGGGNVKITFAGGASYTPGTKQRIMVTVTDSTARIYGFQMSARLASNPINGQAGTFTPVDASTFVLCDDGSERDALPGKVCKSSFPVEFIEHTLANSTNVFNYDWTPPATNVGNITLYAAGNGANANGREDSGDKIYTSSLELTPATTSAAKPAIRAAQPVLQAFSGTAGVSAGTWLEIYGSDLSATTREWAGADFSGNTAPTQLEGVKVNINGKPAFVRYVSPTQINVQAPEDTATGPINVEVVNAGGTSDPVIVQKAKVSPALLTTPSFNVGGRQYVAALFPDFATFVGKTNLIAGVPFRPAKPGDTIIIFAVGCGATTPASPAGQFFGDARPLASPVVVSFGQTIAQSSAFLAANAVGLCQFNVVVPNVADGDISIDATVDGTATGQTLFTTVQK